MRVSAFRFRLLSLREGFREDFILFRAGLLLEKFLIQSLALSSFPRSLASRFLRSLMISFPLTNVRRSYRSFVHTRLCRIVCRFHWQAHKSKCIPIISLSQMRVPFPHFRFFFFSHFFSFFSTFYLVTASRGE